MRPTMFVLILALVLFSPLLHGQTATETPSASPPVAGSVNPVDVIRQIPDGPEKDNVLFWGSVAAGGLSTYLRVSSSWKKVTDVPILREPSGPFQDRFYMRATISTCAVAAGITVAEVYLIRKFPRLKKTFAVLNFGLAAANTGQFGSNLTNH